MDESNKHPQEIISKCDRLITRLESYSKDPDVKLAEAIANICRVKKEICQLELDIEDATENEKRKSLKSKRRKLKKVKYKKAILRIKDLFTRKIAPTYKWMNKRGSMFLEGEINSIVNEVLIYFINEIHEFKPEAEFLKQAIYAWLNGSFRLKYQILELVDLRRKYPTRVSRYWRLTKYIKDNDGYIDLIDYAEQENIQVETARKYLEEICQQNKGKIVRQGDRQVGNETIEGNIYSVNETNYKAMLNDETKIGDSIAKAIKAEIESFLNFDSKDTLDKPANSGDPEGGQIIDNVRSRDRQLLTEQLAEIRNQVPIYKNFKQAVRQALIQDTDKRLTGLCCRDNENWNCHYILLNTNPGTGIQATSLRKLVEGRGISYQTVYAHWKNICYTEICRITVEMANRKGMTEYIQADPRGLLRSCQFNEKTPAINCQNLASELISVEEKKITFVEEKTAKRIRKDVAKKHNIHPVTPLHRFWNQKCLDLLAKVAFEVEDEHFWSQESIKNQRETLIETK